MLIKVDKNEFNEIKFEMSENNYHIMDTFNYENNFYESEEDCDRSFGTDNDYYMRRINLIDVEKRDWGNKEVYLSFDEVIRFIESSKVLYDYKSCRNVVYN